VWSNLRFRHDTLPSDGQIVTLPIQPHTPPHSSYSKVYTSDKQETPEKEEEMNTHTNEKDKLTEQSKKQKKMNPEKFSPFLKM